MSELVSVYFLMMSEIDENIQSCKCWLFIDIYTGLTYPLVEVHLPNFGAGEPLMHTLFLKMYFSEKIRFDIHVILCPPCGQLVAGKQLHLNQ